MKLERVGEHWERVEWSGAVGERLEIWDLTEKGLGGTGGHWRERRDLGGTGRALGERAELCEWIGNGMPVE